MVKILNHPKVNKKQKWGQLYGCSLSLALAEFCFEQPGVKLVIAKDNLHAQQLLAELAFFLPKDENLQDLIFFPDWEILPYDQLSPHHELISWRLSLLSKIPTLQNAIVVSSASTLMHRLCPPQFLHLHSLLLAENQALNFEDFRTYLQIAGYNYVNTVLEHGEYATRGSIIDVYPTGSNEPVRIELFDNTIASLRYFDPDSQKTINKVPKIEILPAHEYPLNEQSISLFRRNFREEFTVNPSQCPIYEAISAGKSFPGVEYYLPLFFSQSATFFDYLPKNAYLCIIEKVQEKAEEFWQEILMRYEQRHFDISRPILAPNKIFLNPIELLTHANQYPQLRCQQEPTAHGFNFNTAKPQELLLDRKAQNPLAKLCEYLNNRQKKFLLVVESMGRREALLELLHEQNIFPTLQESWESFLESNTLINIVTGDLQAGADYEEQFSIIVEAQIFGEQAVASRNIYRKVQDPDVIIRTLAELKVGDPVVHITYGVGRYLGLQTIATDLLLNEFLVLAYANDDKIYVPVTALHLISRYTGVDSEHTPLHKLGSGQWQKEKQKAVTKVHDVASELLEVYAKREAKIGHVYKIEHKEYQQFVSDFSFIETPDQTRAMEEIIRDFQSTRPMDRLICGDVGFGKTEVAMRAAFIAIQNGKQVCVLVPTTLLASQHMEIFRNRFANFPVNIDLLSRFRTAKESTKIVSKIANGQIDLIICTHKIFSKEIVFKNLGLLIIDEEHRFGVKQKEYIKSLHTGIDILSMTATPIPRTLNMAMSGIRDISLIASPPANRLTIKSFWQERNNLVIREGILREILRGGQVFFLHNKVQTIDKICQELHELVPEAQIRRAHGQMHERELEHIMTDFYHNRFNVLVCTTIIENGIDLPNANTIIIDRADQFGLAQLYQLRGRVGRSHHQAYAYLLTPNVKLLNADAIKRLEAIMSLEALGSGFTLATYDLEIRGAGELLGAEQSGNIQAIGFNLYMELLDQAVNDLKSGKIPDLDLTQKELGPELDLKLSAIIPEDYVGDVHSRLIMYKRIANAKDKQQLRDLQIEMIDRFGLLPKPTKNLFAITQLKLIASPCGITKITASKNLITIWFNNQPNINTEALIKLLNNEPKRYQMNGPSCLRYVFQESDTNIDNESIIELVQDLIRYFYKAQ